MIALAAGAATATVVPDAGGRVGSLRVGATELLVTSRPDDRSHLWGSFPMAPWAGRLRLGRFTHDGITHQLPCDLPPHAIHGTVSSRPWSVDAADGRITALSIDLGPRWPLGGTAHQRIELTPGSLRCTLRVTAGGRSMPVTLGWHPWFRATDVRLEATAMYERGADHVPTGVLVAPGARPWDDCFVTTQPVGLGIGELDVEVGSDCDHVVVFDELAIGIAVEPQSGPPDALNLRAEVLGPGASIERTMTIAWQGAG